MEKIYFLIKIYKKTPLKENEITAHAPVGTYTQVLFWKVTHHVRGSFSFYWYWGLKDVLTKWSPYIISHIHSQWLSGNKFTFLNLDIPKFIFKVLFISILFLEGITISMALLQYYYCIYNTKNMLDTLLQCMHSHFYFCSLLHTHGSMCLTEFPFLFLIYISLSLSSIFLFFSIFFTLSCSPRTFLPFLPSVLPCIA